MTQKYPRGHVETLRAGVDVMRGFRGELGARGEDIAARHLESRGFVVLERNFRCRTGEIDIVALDGDVIVFVEVKTRRPGRFGAAKEQVTMEKRRRIARAAQAYVASRGADESACRFDVVAIDLVPGRAPNVELIPGAFDCRR